MPEKYTNIHQHLIDDCRNGDTKAQFELYKLYYKAMYNTGLRILNNSQEAEDVMQEAFLKAFQKLDTYKEEVSFGAWLKKIVVNHSLDYLKKNKLDTDQMDEGRMQIADEVGLAAEDEQVQQVQLIKRAISQLSENYRVIVNLHLIEGYDHDEIGEILGMTNAAVRTAFSRGRKNLQKILEEQKVLPWMN